MSEYVLFLDADSENFSTNRLISLCAKGLQLLMSLPTKNVLSNFFVILGIDGVVAIKVSEIFCHTYIVVFVSHLGEVC